MRRHFGVTIAFLLSTFRLLAQPSLGDVTIHVIGASGETVIGCSVKRFATRNGADLASKFMGLRGVGIPYGTYDFVLWSNPLTAPGEVPGTGQICVDGGKIDVRHRETFVVVRYSGPPHGISVDGNFSNFVIEGKLVGSPANPPDKIWIRFSPLLPDGRTTDVEVGREGEFRIYEALGGQYVATIRAGAEVLDMQEVIFDQGLRSGAKLSLTISRTRPPATRVK